MRRRPVERRDLVLQRHVDEEVRYVLLPVSEDGPQDWPESARSGCGAVGPRVDLQSLYLALQPMTLLVGRREPVLEVICEKNALDEERPGVSSDKARVAAE